MPEPCECRTCGLSHVLGIEGLVCDELNAPQTSFSQPFRTWVATEMPDLWVAAMARQRREQGARKHL